MFLVGIIKFRCVKNKRSVRMFGTQAAESVLGYLPIRAGDNLLTFPSPPFLINPK